MPLPLRSRWLAAVLLLAPCMFARAEPRPVTVRAADGLTLHGTWHPSDRPTGRAVLLLHEMCGNRAAWAPLLAGLAAAGIDALAVDLRGFGETGGRMEWDAEVGDARAWLEWMRAQPTPPSRVGVMGESLGAKLALVVCSGDRRCGAALALSPYGTYSPEQLDFHDRAVFLLGTRGDDVRSALAVRRMAAEVQGDVTIRLVAGNEPGVATLLEGGQDLVAEAVAWVDRHL